MNNMKRFFLLALTAGLLSPNVNACDSEIIFYDDVKVHTLDTIMVDCFAEYLDKELKVVCLDEN